MAHKPVPAPTRSGRPWLLIALVTVLVAGGLVLFVELNSSGSSSAQAAPTLADAQRLLDARAQAVLTRDRGTFTAEMDSGAASTDFRTRQLAEFDNLDAVSLGSWAYLVGAAPSPDDSATARYAAPTLTVRVTLRYTLAGFDQTPATHPLWLSFVRRHGKTVLAADTDLAASGGLSWRGPWDFGPILTRRDATSLILGHPSHAGALSAIQSDVDAAIPVVSSVWGSGWARQVVVIVPDTAAEASAVAGSDVDLTGLDALSVVESAGATPVQRVIVNPGPFAALSSVGARIVLQHEITHIATRPTTGGQTPTWVIEGFAEYVGNLDSGQPVAIAAQELRAAIRRGALPTALPAEDNFAGSSGVAALAYEQAWLACRYLAQEAGQAGLVRFYRLVSGSSAPNAVEVGLRTVVGQTPAAFTAGWVAYLRMTLR